MNIKTKSGITETNARAIAYHLRQGEDNGGVERNSLALYLDGVADSIAKLRDRIEELEEGLRWLLEETKSAGFSWVHLKSEPCRCKSCAMEEAARLLRSERMMGKLKVLIDKDTKKWLDSHCRFYFGMDSDEILAMQERVTALEEVRKAANEVNNELILHTFRHLETEFSPAFVSNHKKLTDALEECHTSTRSES